MAIRSLLITFKVGFFNDVSDTWAIKKKDTLVYTVRSSLARSGAGQHVLQLFKLSKMHYVNNLRLMNSMKDMIHSFQNSLTIKYTWPPVIAWLHIVKIINNESLCILLNVLEKEKLWCFSLGLYVSYTKICFNFNTYVPPSKKLQTLSSLLETSWKDSLMIFCCISSF